MPAGSERVWALLDDRPGNRNQVLGVAEALGRPFEAREVRFNPLAALPNGLLGETRRSIEPANREQLAPPWPSLVIAAGRRSVPVARWLKRQSPQAFLVQLMWPGSLQGLDLVAVPEHDDVAPDPRIVRTVGSPHRLTPARLAADGRTFEPQVLHLPRPWIACLVGGSSRHARVGAEAFRGFASRVSSLARERESSLLVTTSRRTGSEGEQILGEALADQPHFLHRFGAGGANPYPGLLGVADAVVVSGDSASMVTEACAAGCPAFLYDLSRPPPKLARLHARLQELGHLHPLGSAWPEHVPAPLLPQVTVAEAIHAARRVAR